MNSSIVRAIMSILYISCYKVKLTSVFMKTKNNPIRKKNTNMKFRWCKNFNNQFLLSSKIIFSVSLNIKKILSVE